MPFKSEEIIFDPVNQYGQKTVPSRTFCFYIKSNTTSTFVSTSCRESLSELFLLPRINLKNVYVNKKLEDRNLFLCTSSESNTIGQDLAYAIDEVENLINIGERTVINPTSMEYVFSINIASFWKSNSVRFGIFTALLKTFYSEVTARKLMYLSSIECAKDIIQISNEYFNYFKSESLLQYFLDGNTFINENFINYGSNFSNLGKAYESNKFFSESKNCEISIKNLSPEKILCNPRKFSHEQYLQKIDNLIKIYKNVTWEQAETFTALNSLI